MPHKCIYTHIHQEFTIWSRIKVYKGDTNVYGPLWTLSCICAMWIYFLIILYIFPILFFFPKDFITPHIIDNHMTDFPHHHSIMYDFNPPPYILLFTPHSPVICKDNFPLVHMYKLSRYYLVFDIDLGPMFPWSTSL